MTKKPGLAMALIILAFLMPVSSNLSAGGPIGKDFLIYDDTLVTESLPALAYNTQTHEFLVVWQAETIASGAFEVWGRRVSAHGVPLGSAFRISMAGVGEQPDVAYNPTANEYLVVWHQSLAVVGQRVAASGALQGSAFTVAAGVAMLTTTCDQPAVTYASTADRYLVVYHFRNATLGGSAIRARAYLPDGTPEADSFDIAAYSTTTDPEEPDVAYNRSRNEALVVWQESFSADDLDLHAGLVEFAGGTTSLMSSFPLAQTIHDERLPAVAAIPTVPDEGQYLATYQVDPDDINHDIHAKVVSGTGTPGALVTLANTGWSELRPSVAGCGSNQQFLVVWVWIPVVTPPAIMQVQARTLALDANPLHATTTMAGRQVFDAAVAAGNVCNALVAFDDNATVGTFSRGIYGRFWGARVFLPLVVRDL